MATFTLEKPFTLAEIRMAAQCLSALLETIPLNVSLAEMCEMQASRHEFWQAALEHMKRDQPLHSFIREHWPAMFATPIEIGEQTGSLSTVFDSIASTTQLQLTIQATLRKLIYPVSIMLAGFGTCIFFLLVVVPSMSLGDQDPTKVSALMKTSIALHVFLWAHPMAIAVVGIGLAFWIYSALRQPTAISYLLAGIDHVPILSVAVRELYYGLWARYIALMIQCGVSLQEAIPLSYPLLLEYMVPGLRAIHENARMGYAAAATTTNLPDTDPRHRIPIFIRNAFRLTDQTGNGDRHFNVAADPLIKLGMERIVRFIDMSGHVATAVAGVFAFAPLGMYFSQMIDMITGLTH